MTVDVPCEDAFDVVASIEAYPDFIDGCKAARLIDKHDSERHAELTMSIAGIEDRFPVRMQLEPGANVAMQLGTRYVRRLDADWQFRASGPGQCEIALYAECDFGSRAKELLLGSAIDRTCLTLIEAVAAEAARRKAPS